MRAASWAAAASGSTLETGGVPPLPSTSAAGLSCGLAPVGMLPAPCRLLAACTLPLASLPLSLLAGCAPPLLSHASVCVSGSVLAAPAGMLPAAVGGNGGTQSAPSCSGLSSAASMRASSSSGRIQDRLCPSRDLYL